MVEKGALGGTCVNVGCVPKKVMWYAAHHAHQFHHLADYGFDGEVIGYVGATGNTTANHLHFEVHPGGGRAVNPYPYVRAVC